MAHTDDLQNLIARFARQYGSLSELGKAIGLSPSRLSRLARGDQGSLEVVNCLKLADVTGFSPSRLLRAAGKADVAVLIEKLYRSRGRAATMPALPPEQRAIIAIWEGLPRPADRAAALDALRYVATLAAEIQQAAAQAQQAAGEVQRLAAEVERLQTRLRSLPPPAPPASEAARATRLLAEPKKRMGR